MTEIFPDAIKELRRVAREAFRGVHRASGKPADDDVRLYESLSEEDFDRMSKMYGIDETLRYIRTMEFKRMSMERG
jgi:hypothetical protein